MSCSGLENVPASVATNWLAGCRSDVDRVVEWEETGYISVAQVDRLAERTHTPLGLLYLSKPPEDKLPIPDFRTRHTQVAPLRPSLDLFETVYAMQRRQDWMRDDLIEIGAEPLEFVGAYSREHDPVIVANAMRDVLGIVDNWAEERRILDCRASGSSGANWMLLAFSSFLTGS